MALTEKDKNSDSPLIKIWCAVHRQNLAFRKMSKRHPEVGDLIKEATLVSSHCHSSSLRTFKISQIAVHYPRYKKEKCTRDQNFSKAKNDFSYFEVRWTEFTNSMLEAILKNWRASMQYFVEEKETRLKNIWLDKDRIHLTSLLSDMSFIYKCFQKTFVK